MKKDDRRIRKTKKALQEGLIELLETKELRSITVRELTDMADVHRGTFYAHYTDVYDLYEQMENVALEIISEIITSSPNHNYDSLFTMIIDYVYENQKMCNLFLGENLNKGFYQRVSLLVEEKYIEIYQFETGGSEITEEQYYLFRYHMQGCLSILRRWTREGFQYPKEKIRALLVKLDENFEKIDDLPI